MRVDGGGLGLLAAEAAPAQTPLALRESFTLISVFLVRR